MEDFLGRLGVKQKIMVCVSAIFIVVLVVLGAAILAVNYL